METFRTEQESFWRGSFGDQYTQRNQGPNCLYPRIALFAKILARTRGVESALELGANVGLNMLALRSLKPDIGLAAVEINESAVKQLKQIPDLKVYPQSILDVEVEGSYDLTFTKGVLIHINPEVLPSVYEKLYRASKRYICVAEYYNPTPVMVPYRDNQDRLYKRDFAGEILDTYPDLVLVDYGFTYHRDANFPQDDGTWFLLEKTR